jgi:hypothetical protein
MAGSFAHEGDQSLPKKLNAPFSIGLNDHWRFLSRGEVIAGLLALDASPHTYP